MKTQSNTRFPRHYNAIFFLESPLAFFQNVIGVLLFQHSIYLNKFLPEDSYFLNEIRKVLEFRYRDKAELRKNK